jgi:hypothetical protein
MGRTGPDRTGTAGDRRCSSGRWRTDQRTHHPARGNRPTSAGSDPQTQESLPVGQALRTGDRRAALPLALADPSLPIQSVGCRPQVTSQCGGYRGVAGEPFDHGSDPLDRVPQILAGPTTDRAGSTSPAVAYPAPTRCPVFLDTGRGGAGFPVALPSEAPTGDRPSTDGAWIVSVYHGAVVHCPVALTHDVTPYLCNVVLCGPGVNSL